MRLDQIDKVSWQTEALKNAWHYARQKELAENRKRKRVKATEVKL